MDVSILVARILGVTYTAVGLGMLISGDHYRKMLNDFSKSPSAVYLGAFLALITGILLVSFHNVWEGNWKIVITLIGWLALAKGVIMLIFPPALMNFT